MFDRSAAWTLAKHRAACARLPASGRWPLALLDRIEIHLVSRTTNAAVESEERVVRAIHLVAVVINRHFCCDYTVGEQREIANPMRVISASHISARPVCHC